MEPSTPRIISRPTWEPMLRAADLTIASTIVSLRRALPLPPNSPPSRSVTEEPPDCAVVSRCADSSGLAEASSGAGCFANSAWLGGLPGRFWEESLW
jgi:hypothetical protein